ncbi:MAG: energy transducer TonB [Bryobacteraceae bacterium]|jgi:hypothetical protein
MRLVAAIGALLLLVSCRRSDSLDLRAPKPPGVPIFAGDTLRTPRLLHMEKPRYPAELRYLGAQTVRLRCRILEDGRVVDIAFESGPEPLWPYARAAVAQWRYEPVRLYSPFTGRSAPQAVVVMIEVRFEPRNQRSPSGV